MCNQGLQEVRHIEIQVAQELQEGNRSASDEQGERQEYARQEVCRWQENVGSTMGLCKSEQVSSTQEKSRVRPRFTEVIEWQEFAINTQAR